MKIVDGLTGLAGIALSLALLLWIIPTQIEQGQWHGLPPTFFPNLVAGAIGLASAGLVVRTVLVPQSPDEAAFPISLVQFAMMTLCVAIILVGLVLTDRVGMWAGGPFIIAALMLFMGERRPLVILPSATLPVGIVYVLTFHVLKSPLP